jgi:hypothetical protein
MTLAKAIAEAIAGGIAGYATVATNKDFLSPLLSGMQAQQDRDARASERAKDREFTTGERRAGQAFQQGESAADRAARAKEAAESRKFTTGEREAGQKFTAGEAATLRGFTTSERLSGQEFLKGEAESGRAFATGEREAGQTFTSGENAAGRTFTTSEREAAERIRGKEAAVGRTFTTSEREAAERIRGKEAAIGRTFTTSEREAGQGFVIGESEKERASRLDLQQAQQVFLSKERELRDASDDTRAIRLQEFTAAQAELDRTQRVVLQTQQEAFQLKQAAREREFQIGKMKAELTGDFSFLSTLPPSGDPVADITRNVQFVTETMQKRDDQHRADFKEGMSTKLTIARERLVQSPTDFLQGYDALVGGLKQRAVEAVRGAKVPATQRLIQEETASYIAQLESMQQQAEAGAVKSQIDGGIVDLTEVPDAVIRAATQEDFGPKSPGQAVYSDALDIVGLLETLPEVTAEDIDDHDVQSLVTALESPGAGNQALALAGGGAGTAQMGPRPTGQLQQQIVRDKKGAAALIPMIQNTPPKRLDLAKQRLSRLNTSRAFNKDMEVALEGAGKRAGVEFSLPEGAFSQNPEGKMALTGGGVQAVADMITSQFTDEDGAYNALVAWDDIADSAFLGEAERKHVAERIARNPDQVRALNDAFEGRGGKMGRLATHTFNRVPPSVAFQLREEIRGLDEGPARKRLVELGYRAGDLELVRKGGKVLGAQVVKLALPDGEAIKADLAQIERDLHVARSGGIAKSGDVAALEQQAASLRAMAGSGMSSRAEVAFTDMATALATGNIGELYDKITSTPGGVDFLSAALQKEDGYKPKEHFITTMKGGATEGDKIALGLQWIANNNLYGQGTAGQYGTAVELEFNRFITDYADDFGQLIDDTLLEMDFEAEFITEYDWFSPNEVERRPDRARLMYLYSEVPIKANQILNTDPVRRSKNAAERKAIKDR